YPSDRSKAGNAREKMGATDTPESLTGRVNATFRRRLRASRISHGCRSHPRGDYAPIYVSAEILITSGAFSK
ncbi:hypothetical protein, partial [Sphingobium sp. R-7]|uniref:hypothetical protein n=1 Tax=Sphingobium sp. R-7 TaxID=3375449 RepID=UPI00398A5166